ncbi:MAG: ABC transporter permease [Nitrospiraceae bacterium]
MTGFPLKMAWRETRGAWRHFLYFLVCIALGVGALVGVALFAANVERAVAREARGLLGGDLEIRLTRPVSDNGKEVLQSLAQRGILISHASELVAMAADGREDAGQQPRTTQIVELKGVEPNYPLYGAVIVEPARPLTDLLALSERSCGKASGSPSLALSALRASRFMSHATCFGAVVQQSLLIRMGLSAGDRLKIGQATFVITGVIRKEPDRMANAFSLGPRVMISRDGLAAADLIKLGSRVRERYLLKVPPDTSLHPLLYELRGRLSSDGARVSTYRDAQPQLKQFLDQLARYLGLVGLTALFVGGIGVATSVRAFLREKLQTIAILKTLGAESSTVVRTYLGQALLLGCIGSAAGLLIGVALQHLVPHLLMRTFAVELLDQIQFSSTLELSSALPIFKGLALGVLTTLLFTAWPLLGIREIRPALIFRREIGTLEMEQTSRSDWKASATQWLRNLDRTSLGVAVGIGGGLITLSIWQAESWQIGLLFLGAVTLAVLLLWLAAALLVRALRFVPAPRALSIRHAIGNVHRPGTQATSVMMSIGIGVMVIVAVGLLERSLLQQIGDNRPTDAPTFFFIDIQPDQVEGLRRLLHERTGEMAPQVTPLVRARLAAVNGQAVKNESVTEEEEQKQEARSEKRKNWYLSREYVLTHLDRLPKDNSLVQGKWWEPGETFTRPLVSVEEEAAKYLGVEIGSALEFDIQGVTMSAEVSSIRKVEWGNFSTNFYMILSPGSLENAPITYVATVRVPPEQEVPLQQALVSAFPNVTAINIADVLDNFARMLDRLSLAIRAVAFFCVLAGLLVMAAALAATRYRRLYESVILKALGATRGLIARSFAVEYALMGAVAGLIGVVLASVLSWGVLQFVFDLPWTLQPGLLTVSFVLTIVLTLMVGFLSTFRILGQRPLTVLRHE